MKSNLKISLILASTAALVTACTTSNKSEPPRTPSSASGVVTMVNPLTQETFWDEYQKAKPGFDIENMMNSEFRTGVFFQWVKANPVAVFRDLREKAPVLFLEPNEKKRFAILRGGKKVEGPDYVVLSAAQDVQAVLKDPAKFPFSREQETLVLGMGQKFKGVTENRWIGALHGRDKAQIQALVQPLVEQAVQQGSYVGKDERGRLFGRIEFVNQLGRKVPFILNERIIGLTGFELREATDLSRSLQDDLLFNSHDNPTIRERAQKSTEVLNAYLTKLLDGQIQPPAGTILSELQAHFRQEVGNSAKITKEERRNLVKILAALLGGVENSQTTVARSLEQLMIHGQLERAQRLAQSNDDDGLKKMMYEALRFAPVQSYVVRRANEDVTIPSGQVIKKGTVIIAATQSAMFDEALVQDPYSFRPDRPFKDYMHSRRSGLIQIRDQVTEIESFEILKALLKKPGLRRAEGHFGEIDERRPVTTNLIKTDTYRMSFPERWDLVFDVSALRPGIEIADKDYPYEDYLRDFDRISFRLCLGNVKESLAREDGDDVVTGRDHFWKNMKELGRIIKETPTIIGNIATTRQNRTRENKHLLYCRMPQKFRTCVETAKFKLLDSKDTKAHQEQYAECRSNLTDLEQNFYENVFFQMPIDAKRLSDKQAQRPQDEAYFYEDYLKFYDRYRYRESMMNPVGYVMNDQQMLFYVRLNIDFRMCIGGPALKNKYSMGLAGTPKLEQYNKCKDGLISPVSFRREGALTEYEKYLYERMML